MQTTSHRWLKWTLLMGVAASLASACVVTTHTGDDDDFSFAGESGSSTSSSGKTSTGGSSAGTSAGGKTSSGGGGAATTAGSSVGGAADGGAGSAYVPGLCEADDPTATPTMVPACDAKESDGECLACLKAQCCTLWQDCYGDTPTTACGWGATADADGQFDCIVNCVNDGSDAETCAGKCLNQCADKDNLVLQPTNDLLECANDKCLAKCFPG